MPPQNLEAQVNTAGDVQLSWNCVDAMSVNGFLVERSQNRDSGYAQILAVSTGATSAVDESAGASGDYYYRVRSYIQRGSKYYYSDYSNVASVSLGDVSDPTDPVTDPTDPVTDPTDPVTDPTDPVTDPTDPVTEPTDTTAAYPAPVLQAVEADSSSFVLTWSLPSNPYGVPSGGYDIVIDGADTATEWRTEQTTATITGLEAGVSHTFQVEARWLQADPYEFPRSNIVSGTLATAPAGDTTDPTAAITSPTTGVTIDSEQTLTIVAQASDDVGVVKVEFYDGATLIGTDTTNTYSVAYPVTDADNGTHNLTVVAYDAAGNTTQSAAVAVNVDIAVATAAYPAPVLQTVEADSSSFVLTWSLPSNPYGVPSGGYDIVIDGADTATQWRTEQTTATITGLEAGVSHTFQVEARWLQADPYEFPRSNIVSGTLVADDGGGSDPVDPVEPVDPVDPVVPTDGSVTVFPGAQGYGIDTVAGRGGRIIHVTNLNDSGTGSFRAAVESSGPRIVVFDISGTIELQSDIRISDPYITVAGQTAPAPGIQLRNQTVNVSTHDVLIQHMAFRPGDTFVSGSGGEVHALVVSSSAYNCVFDHLSLYWGIDECVGVYGDNLTFSNCIIAEGLDDSYHPDGPHSCGMLIMGGAHNVALLRNLYAHHNHRSPWVKEDTKVFHANNYAYDSRGTFFNYTTDRDPYTGDLISVSNVYGKGPSSDTTKGLSVSDYFISADVYETDSKGDSESPYGVLSTLVKMDSKYRVDSYPFDPPTYTRLASSEVKSHILAHAGSRPASRDGADARVINDLKNFSGSLIDSPSQVGGWPDYPVNTRVFDAGSNPNGDDDGDGYTNIEETLYEMARTVEGN
jgi:hypothetical protein